MADFNGAVGVATIRDDEFKIKLVDGASGENASNVLTINASGQALTLTDINNEVTVNATDLDIRALESATDSVTVIATDLDIRALESATDSVTVIATDLDIRDLTFAADSIDASGSSIKITDDTETLAINADGSINVVPLNEGTLVNYFQTSAAVASDASADFDYTVTNTSTFEGTNVLVGCRAACKVEVGTFDGTTFTPKFTYFQQPSVNNTVDVQALSLIGDGTAAIRIKVTNLDNQATDIYSTLQGIDK